MVAGVMGWPIGHSLSPRLHGYWLKHHGIDGAYVPLSVHPDHFREALKALPKLGFRGANVTVPHKEQALAYVDRVSDEARRMGAVNTVVVEPDGRLSGSNTDAFGFIANLGAGCPQWTASAGPAVVLGAGGAARAVCTALLDAGAPEIQLSNRTEARARSMAADIGGPISVVPWDQRHDALADAATLVNTTTLGMVGNPPLTLDLSSLPRMALVTDIVYRPLMTPLLQGAKAHGHPIVDGLGMLLHQARPGFAAWFGVMPDVTEALRDFVLGAGSD